MNTVHKIQGSFIMPKIIENLQVSILNAANKILLERGFSDFSIRAVAKQLGIAPATIYNYYPSKESILEALVDKTWVGLMEAIDRETEGIMEPLAALEKVYSLLQSAMNPMFSHWLAPDSKTLPPDHPDERDIFAKKSKIADALTQRIEAVLQRCGQDSAYAPVYAKLFIMCSHRSQLTFGEIVSAIKALQ